LSHYDEFLVFHEANPHVYEALKQIAHQVKAAGKPRYGMKALFERLRWISTFETEGDPYKLNNNYTAFYARMLMEDPDFKGFFAVRNAEADYILKEAA
jgi:hypothetical protein